MNIRKFLNESYHAKKIIGRWSSLIRAFAPYQWLDNLIASKKIAALTKTGFLPESLYIETTNLCNADCIMCPHSRMQRPKGTMDEALFKKIIDDAVAAGISGIGLSFLGEPLLDKHIFERIAYVKDKAAHIKLWFNTNASLLTEDRARRLIELQLDEVRISLDAFDAKTYEEIRCGLNLEDVTANIEGLIALKKEMGALLPRIRLAYVELDRNMGDAHEFYKFWKQKVDHVEIDFARNWAEQMEVDSRTSPHITEYKSHVPCDSIWKELQVQYDGRAVICCNDYDAKVVVGDLSRESILDVWNGEVFTHYRKIHRQNRRRELTLCKRCQKHSFWW